jgi:hypothetical protein
METQEEAHVSFPLIGNPAVEVFLQQLQELVRHCGRWRRRRGGVTTLPAPFLTEMHRQVPEDACESAAAEPGDVPYDTHPVPPEPQDLDPRPSWVKGPTAPVNAPAETAEPPATATAHSEKETQVELDPADKVGLTGPETPQPEKVALLGHEEPSSHRHNATVGSVDVDAADEDSSHFLASTPLPLRHARLGRRNGGTVATRRRPGRVAPGDSRAPRLGRRPSARSRRSAHWAGDGGAPSGRATLSPPGSWRPCSETPWTTPS